MLKHSGFKKVVNDKQLKPTLSSFQTMSTLVTGILKRACAHAVAEKSTTLKSEHIEKVINGQKQ